LYHEGNVSLPPCNKEFIDMQMAEEHIDSTGHELMENFSRN